MAPRVGTSSGPYGDWPTTTLVILYFVAHSMYRYILCRTGRPFPKESSCVSSCVIKLVDLQLKVMTDEDVNTLMPYWKVGRIVPISCRVAGYSVHVSNQPLCHTVPRSAEVPDVNCKWRCHIHGCR